MNDNTKIKKDSSKIISNIQNNLLNEDWILMKLAEISNYEPNEKLDKSISLDTKIIIQQCKINIIESFWNYFLKNVNITNDQLLYYKEENDLISNTSYPIQLKDTLLPLDYATFEKDALIFKKLKSKSIVLLENENPLIRIDYADFPNLGIWTKTNAPFICIEPWNGYADVIDTQSKLSEKDGIQIA